MTTEKTITIPRELEDGTELVLTATVFFTVTRGRRCADRVTAVDYDDDNLYDADGTPYPMTDDEKETVGVEASELRSAMQVEFDDRDEAAAENAWDARDDR